MKFVIDYTNGSYDNNFVIVFVVLIIVKAFLTMPNQLLGIELAYKW